MRVAVVTPYWKEPIDVLERCWRSVRTQTHCDIVHYMVADGHPVQTSRRARMLSTSLCPTAMTLATRPG